MSTVYMKSDILKYNLIKNFTSTSGSKWIFYYKTTFTHYDYVSHLRMMCMEVHIR